MLNLLFLIFFINQFSHQKKKSILSSTKNYYSTRVVTATNYCFQDANFINIGSMNDHVGAIVAYPQSKSSIVQVYDSLFVQCKALNRGGAIEVIEANLYVSSCTFDRCFLYSGVSSQGGISIYHIGNKTNFFFNYSSIKTFDVFPGTNEILSLSNQADIAFLNYQSPFPNGNTFADLTSSQISLNFNNISDVSYPHNSAGFVLHSLNANERYEVSLNFCFFKNLQSLDDAGSVAIFYDNVHLNSTNSSFIRCSPYCFYFAGSHSIVIMDNFCFSTNKGEGFTGNYSINLITGTYKDQVCDRGRLLKFYDVWSYKQTIAISVASATIFLILLYSLFIHIILIRQFHHFRNHFGRNKKKENSSSD